MLDKLRLLFIAILIGLLPMKQGYSQATLEEFLSYPYPSHLCSSPESGLMAWTFNIEGKMNIYVSKDKGKTFEILTHYEKDDGQAISHLTFSPDGKWLIYMRGGEPGGNWSKSTPVNPTSSPTPKKFQLRSVRVSDKKDVLLVNRPYSYTPTISPDSKKVAFVKSGNVWLAPIDGSRKARKLFTANGTSKFLRWSPDSKKLLFVSSRSKHSFIGIYVNKNTPIKWIDPSFARDSYPRWSPNGDSIVFIRRPASGGAPDSLLKRTISPWEIRVADVKSGSSTSIWESSHTLGGSIPTTNGKYNLHWAAKNRIVFLSTEDNWPHLYSIPTSGGDPLLLTPGDFMVEYIKISPDGKQLLFSTNTGPNDLDVDRRHLGTVSVDKQDMKVLTPGDGIEALPVYLDKGDIALISSTAFRPALPGVLRKGQKDIKLIGESLLSSVFVEKNQVKPRQVIFRAADGTPIHGQVYEKEDGVTNKPAVLSIHGGPMRQMLLGWNYSSYYAAQYATNQWLANQGFVVLSVNYRLGIGYGTDFKRPALAGRFGVSEYQDILAAGEWLAKQSNINPKKIGVYGGSYGGYLTAFALGRNSDIFSAGVDIHGVHSRVPSKPYTAGIENAPDAALMDSIVWRSSPIADVPTWTSPVLLIHGDDDRNVSFSHSIILLNRLEAKGVDYETLVIPDDTHHFMVHKHLVKVYKATVDFLERKLKNK